MQDNLPSQESLSPPAEQHEPPSSKEPATLTFKSKRPVKERWIVNPNYPSKTPSTSDIKSMTTQGLSNDPAYQALGGGH